MAEVTARGLRFHVQRLGAGAPSVVFLHGLVMDNLSSWYFTLANRVARFAPALLWDLRGHGRSERPPSGYSVSEMVADLDAVLDAAAVDQPVYLVGNSFGGLLAVSYALAHPQRVAGLVLVDAHLSDQDWGGEMAGTLSLEGDARDQKIAKHFQSWLGRHSERKRNRLAATARALVYETSLVGDLQGSPPVTDDALQTIACPTLAIYGSDSDSRHRGVRLAAMLKDCEFHLLEGCTHSVLWEATDDLCRLATQWLSARTGEPKTRVDYGR
jgi:pimeloyl-ACP methyl ester carboxylesterase